MNVMHMISGGDSGGAKTHLFSLLDKLKSQCNIVVVCLMRGVFYNEILEKDIDTVLFEQKTRFDLSVVKGIKELLKERKIDILHVHGARANFIAMFLKKHISIPIVTTMHSDYRLDFDTFFKKLVYTNLNVLSLNKLDYFIAVSESFREMLIDRNFKPNNIHRVYNGMDYSLVPSEVTSKEDFARDYGFEIEEDCIYVGIAARFDLVKGVDIFIKSAAKAYEKNKKLRFLIAGTGAEEQNLRSLVKSLGMEGKILFLGFVTDMYGFLNFIDINTLASLCESFPYSMLEGAAMKVPMVASRVGGIPELVKDNETGYLFESENTDDFAEKLLLLSADKSEIERMGKNIYEIVTTRFSSEVLANDHMNIYNSIIADYKKENRYDFVLSGYYGFNNSGDDALLLALITDLKEKFESARFAVLSANPSQTQCIYKVDAYHRVSPFRLIKIFKNSKVLLSGGGSLIQDETSSKSLWYYLYIIALAKKCGMKVMQIASGIGPVNKSFNRSLTAKVINKNVDRITLREKKSLDELKSMGVTKSAEVTVDPAVSLEGVSRLRVDEIFAENYVPNGEYICVSLRDWKTLGAEFESDIAKALDYICEKHNKNIVFVPMQYPVDIAISKRISGLMKRESYIIEKSITITEAIGVIRYSSLVIAMRLHSLVYAVSNGVGVIALKYDPKIEGFMDYFERNLIVDVSQMTCEELMNLTDSYFESEQYADNESICSEMKKKAERNAMLAIELLEKDNG